MNQDTIKKAVEHVDLKDSKTFGEAANMLLEDSDIKKGASVAVIDDPTYSLAGIRGVVKGQSAKGSGWMDVELPDGTVMPVQSSLLLAL